MCNESVRETAKKNGVKHWQIADHIGVSEQTFMRWLRKPLPKEKENQILSAINELACVEVQT